MPEVLRGLDLLIYVPVDSVQTAIGGQKGCTLTMEADNIDVSNKNDYGWTSTIGGAKSWSVSCDGQFIATDAGQKALVQAFIAGDEVKVEMRNSDSSVYFGGTAAITSLEIDAQFDDVCTLSMELMGIGALSLEQG